MSIFNRKVFCSFSQNLLICLHKAFRITPFGQAGKNLFIEKPPSTARVCSQVCHIAELAAVILKTVKSTVAACVYEGPSIHKRVPKILSERGLGVPKIPGSPKIYDTGVD